MSVGMKLYVRELVARLPKVATDLEFVPIMAGELRSENASWAEQFALPRQIAGSGARLAHYMSVYAPRWSPTPYVYTIHDLIHRRFPEYHSWKIPLYYGLVVGPVARRAQVVITDARATVADLGLFLGVRGEQVRVVPLGVGEVFALDDAGRSVRGARARERFGLAAPFFLYAGNHRRHKNLEILVAAWQQTKASCDLVITEDGPFAFDVDRYQKPNGRMLRLGHLAEQDLVDLYAGCAATVQPSLYEGFGLAVLEAMAGGAPVIVAATPALVEVAGEAALQFPPLDVGALSNILDRLLADAVLRERLRAAGHARVREFSWEATARRTADVYREALNALGSRRK